MHTKVQISDDCKAEYAVEIQKTNDVQRDHYGNTVPQLFNVKTCLFRFFLVKGVPFAL
jgi:hypothetical protein